MGHFWQKLKQKLNALEDTDEEEEEEEAEPREEAEDTSQGSTQTSGSYEKEEPEKPEVLVESFTAKRFGLFYIFLVWIKNQNSVYKKTIKRFKKLEIILYTWTLKCQDLLMN